jgi:hypothetical protein
MKQRRTRAAQQRELSARCATKEDRVAARPVLVERLELGRKGTRWGSGAVRWTESTALLLAS